jgi:hypothetical protein
MRWWRFGFRQPQSFFESAETAVLQAGLGGRAVRGGVPATT